MTARIARTWMVHHRIWDGRLRGFDATEIRIGQVWYIPPSSRQGYALVTGDTKQEAIKKGKLLIKEEMSL